MRKPYQCAVLYHNYYSLAGIDDIRERIAKLEDQNILLLTSLPEKLLGEGIPANTENEKFLVTTNQGKDIGGKLVLLDLVLKLYPEIPYLILLHDKRSYQKFSGSFEKEKLFEIINPEKYAAALDLLEKDPKVGIVGQHQCIRNEFSKKKNAFKTTNSTILKQLLADYSLETADHKFVAGTMFWVRTSIFAGFFKTNNPIRIKATLETGNVLDDTNGTVTHSWERLLCWLATAAGYKIEGV
jgi:lipopolysaccharide biosynthesis protein